MAEGEGKWEVLGKKQTCREGLGEVGGEGCVDEDQAVQLAHVGGHRQRGNGVKHAQRVALVQQLLRGTNARSTPATC